jgi:[NiFe] hydrogenase assembly HybE family chaperone
LRGIPDMHAVAARAAELEALFQRIAATRMAGVPILHPRLAVKAVGFEAVDEGRAAAGVLLTPWFMNLVWLPLAAPAGVAGDAAHEPALPVGATRTRAVGNERFDFLGAYEVGFGAYESCSLFSPMNDFADQAGALATAEQVLAILRRPAPAPAGAPTDKPASRRELAASADRRALLFGRRGTAA